MVNNNNMKTQTTREILIESAVQGLYYLAAIREAQLKSDKERGLPESYIDERQLEIDEKKQLAKSFLRFAETL